MDGNFLKDSSTNVCGSFRSLLLNLLNRDPALARQAIQIDAAEGFHSLLQHINNIKERLMSMSTEHLLIADKPLAQALCKN